MVTHTQPKGRQGRIRSALLRTGLALAIGIAGFALPAGAGQVSAEDDATRPFIVKIHADWCGICTQLDPTFEALDARLGARARIVVLDVTSKETLARASEEADRLGIREFFDRYKSKTGTVGVLDGATREPVSVLRGETDVSVYEAAVAEATAGGSS